MGEKGESGGPRGIGGGASMLKLQTNKNKVFWHCFQQSVCTSKTCWPSVQEEATDSLQQCHIPYTG